MLNLQRPYPSHSTYTTWTATMRRFCSVKCAVAKSCWSAPVHQRASHDQLCTALSLDQHELEKDPQADFLHFNSRVYRICSIAIFLWSSARLSIATGSNEEC